MEPAQCTAKSKLLDESGSLLIAMAFVLLVSGAIGYFMSISDKVDKQVRSLGATQRTAYLKGDIQETIRKTLMANNPDCLASTVGLLRNKFVNFLATVDEARYNYNFVYNPSTGVKITSSPDARCFFHPSRYSGIEFLNANIDIVRASVPNFITLSSFITVSVNIGIKAGDAKTQLKYSLRYRVDVLTTNHFGMIFDHTNKLFNLEDDSRLIVNSWVLVDQADRNNPLPLTNFLNIPDYSRVRFNKAFWMASPSLATDTFSIAYLNDKKISDNFAYGILYDVLPRTPEAKGPYQALINERWNELFNYDVMDVIYPMPSRPSGGMTAIFSPSTSAVIYSYDKAKDNTTPYTDDIKTDTGKIYQRLMGNKNLLYKSCAQSDHSRGQFNLLIFNNLNANFTIDFSDNITPGTPPVFCGLIAAANLTIILNDQTLDNIKEHHFIGKIIVKNTITIKKKGTIHFHDVMSVTNEAIPYAIDDLTNVKLQYYKQKYFSSQNFQLPYFKNVNTVYNLGVDSDRGPYIPRHTGHFFDQGCTGNPGKWCRRDEIDVPNEKQLVTLEQNNVLFEVFNVE